MNEKCEKSKTLMHVSFDPVEKFSPRVPKFRIPGENETIPRICLTTSIQFALSAMPGGSQAMRSMLRLAKYITPVLHVYECKVSPPYKKTGFLTPCVVEKYVKYAIYDDEWWALKTPTFTHRLVSVTSAEFREYIDVFGKKRIGNQLG